MKKILAVSGGIDSVVLLHLFKDEDPIVAHFDHGIRPNSRDDAAFVRSLAQKYGLRFELGQAKLGDKCGEAEARSRRYAFLGDLSKKNDATVCVAHHADDVLESIAINLIRGTGWRGIAPMNASGIERPLLKWRKSDIYRYASEHDLSFRQDQTNTEGDYLRNRVREKMRDVPESTKCAILELYVKQTQLLAEYAAIMDDIFSGNNRDYCTKAIIQDSPDDCALEIMRFYMAERGLSLTRPQLKKCVEAVRKYSPKKRLSLNHERFLEVNKYSFHVV